MSRDDLYREAVEQRRDELLREGKRITEAERLAKEQVTHDNADPASE